MRLTLLEQTSTTYRFITPEGLEVTYPRVTSALQLVNPGLRRIPAEVLARASARGRAVHRGVWLLETEHGGGMDWGSVDVRIRGYLDAYLAAKMQLSFLAIWSEQLIISERYGYAGTADLGVEQGARFAVLDLKTGIEHPTHALQLAAYAEGVKAQHNLRSAPERWILYLHADGTYDYRVLPRAEHARDFAAFTNILQAYRWLQAHGGTNGS